MTRSRDHCRFDRARGGHRASEQPDRLRRASSDPAPRRGNLTGVTPRAALFLAGSFLLALAGGCDSASVYEQCAKPDKEFSGEERCFPSTFAQEDKRAREAAGFVTIGIERVPNAVVSMNGAVTTTDSSGTYWFRDTPFRYDVSARVDEDVIALRGVAQRVVDLVIERDVPIKAFTAKVVLALKDAPRAGHRLAFFASGDNVVGLSGDLASGLTVASRTFENDKAKIHVVEYPEDVGLAGADAKGSVDVRVRADTATSASVELEPLTEAKETRFELNPPPPPGFDLEDVELLLDFGTRLSRTTVRAIPIGTKVVLPVMKDAGWLARRKATRADGAIASIGLRPFSPGDTVDLALYAPPEAVRNEGDVLFAKSAQGAGVFEHTLVPVAGAGKTIHVFSARDDAKVPDLQALGLPPARGEYRWTVRVFPDFAFVEAMSGIENRLYRSASTSRPRTIVLP